MWRGRLSPRRVDVLIRGLPPDSATRQALNEGEPLWTRTDFILADLVDATNGVQWTVANKDVERRNRQQLPEPYPRPGLKRRKRKEITAAELLAFRERTKGA